MQENYNNQPYYDDEQEIDIMELISKLWKKRSMIIKWCIVGAVIGLVAGFSIPKTYRAGVTLVPEVQQKTSSGVSSIASMMGVNLNNSVDAISAEMFPDIVHSTAFVYELFDLPVTFERNDVRATLESCPPDLAADLIDRGIMLAGGGALLSGLDKLLSEETGLPVFVADEPLNAVVKGTGVMLQEDNLDKIWG